MMWILFILSAVVVVYAGSKLTIYADLLAEEFGLTRSWVGLLLVGLVTSLPEIVTSMTAATAVAAPDLAVGNIFGSVLFNLSIIGLCDLVFRRGGLLRLAGGRHALSAAFNILLLALVLLGIMFPAAVEVAGLHFGFGSLVVIVTCVGAFIVLYRFDLLEVPEAAVEALSVAGRRRQVLIRFGLAAGGVLVGGFILVNAAEALARTMGLSDTFFGALFLAFVTSLPELTVSVTALRIKSYDLLLANIMGSNMFNVLVISLCDLAYTPAAFRLPGNLSWGHAFTGLMGIVATCIVILVLVYRPARRRWMGPESFLLVGVYLVSMLGLFFGWGVR